MRWILDLTPTKLHTTSPSLLPLTSFFCLSPSTVDTTSPPVYGSLVDYATISKVVVESPPPSISRNTWIRFETCLLEKFTPGDHSIAAPIGTG